MDANGINAQADKLAAEAVKEAYSKANIDNWPNAIATQESGGHQWHTRDDPYGRWKKAMSSSAKRTPSTCIKSLRMRGLPLPGAWAGCMTKKTIETARQRA